MTPEEAQQHAEHLCDVFPHDNNVDHIGVISEIKSDGETVVALVGGHPQHDDLWYDVLDLTTSCQIGTRPNDDAA